MMKRFAAMFAALLVAGIVPPSHAAQVGAPSPPDALGEEINRLDSAFFDAFNGCNLEALGAFLDDGIEFYHDKGGLTVGRDRMLAMEQERCGRTDTRLRREVVEGSREVYPLPGYGAAQSGAHRFHLAEGGGPERLVEVGRFMHVWRKTADGWRITRAISYDHRAP